MLRIGKRMGVTLLSQRVTDERLQSILKWHAFVSFFTSLFREFRLPIHKRLFARRRTISFREDFGKTVHKSVVPLLDGVLSPDSM